MHFSHPDLPLLVSKGSRGRVLYLPMCQHEIAEDQVVAGNFAQAMINVTLQANTIMPSRDEEETLRCMRAFQFNTGRGLQEAGVSFNEQFKKVRLFKLHSIYFKPFICV